MLRATAPPEAEYAMFDIGEIELRASEPGRVREHGYQTTVEMARTRLANVGMTTAVARSFAEAMHPVLSDAYARGAAVRRVARYLGPLELFQSEGYDGAAHAYRGVFLDLATLSENLELEHASATLHALYLACVLETEPDDATVLLSTDASTKGSKPGARTYKRPSFTDPKRLLNALGGLAHHAPKPAPIDPLPRADVIAFLRTRADSATDAESRQLYKHLEDAVSLRDTPEKGPLASTDLWAIEARLESGELEGIVEAVDDAERRHGRTPGTTYLRSRASLLLRLEPAKNIAERVSALALSMTSFQELALLAAEAWLDADEPRRAMPYARDLVDATDVDEGLLLRAQRILARAVGAAPQKKTLIDSVPPTPLRAVASRPPGMLEPLGSMTPSLGDVEDLASIAAAAIASEPPIALAELLEPEHVLPAVSTPPPPRPSRAAPPPLPSMRPSGHPSARPSAFPMSRSSRPPRHAAPLPSSRRIPVAQPANPSSIPSLPRAGMPRDLAPLVDGTDRRTPVPASEEPPIFGTSSPSELPPPLSSHPTPLSPPEPALELELPLDPAASFTLDLPGPDLLPPAVAQSSVPPVKPSFRPRISGVMMETRPPAGFDPRAEPDSPIIPRRTSSPRQASIQPEVRSSAAPARRSAQPEPAEPTPHDRPTPLRPPGASTDARDEPTITATAPNLFELANEPTVSRPSPSIGPSPLLDSNDWGLEPVDDPDGEDEPPLDLEAMLPPAPPPRTYMHGASLPPFRLESPAPLLPKAPLLPRLGGSSDELAEHLPLPPGLGGENPALDVLPTSVLEARVQFTLLARELGLDYRLKRGIDLRADVSGIEAMQSVLLESFPDHVVRTADESYELRRHGALLSEILARRLDAEWLDISPNELGYWVMIVPPDTRVWPFGRVARLIAMGHKERDLVSYFFELQSRARGR